VLLLGEGPVRLDGRREDNAVAATACDEAGFGSCIPPFALTFSFAHMLCTVMDQSPVGEPSAPTLALLIPVAVCVVSFSRYRWIHSHCSTVLDYLFKTLDLEFC